VSIPLPSPIGGAFGKGTSLLGLDGLASSMTDALIPHVVYPVGPWPFGSGSTIMSVVPNSWWPLGLRPVPETAGSGGPGCRGI
jgi:hypothetical protein